MPDDATRRFTHTAGFGAFVVTAAIWFLAKFLRFSFPALFPVYRTEFAVTNAELGLAFSAMMAVYSVMQFPSGALADSIGSARIIAAGAGLAGLGALVLVVPAPFAVLLAGMALVGLGTGAHKTVAITLLARVYPDRTGRALGLFDTLGALGGVAAPTAVVIATAVAGWRTLFLAGAVAAFGLAGGMLLVVPDRVRDGRTGGRTRGELAIRPYLALFRDRRIALFAGAMLGFGFAYTGVAAFLPLYLTDRGLAPRTASLLYSSLFAASFVQILTGAASDRIGRLPLSAVLLGVAGIALGILVALGRAGPLALGATVVVFGVGAHGFRPIRGAYLTAVIPDDAGGGGVGLVRTLLQAASAVAPAVVGVLADTAGFAVAFGVLAAVVGLAAVLVLAVALGDPPVGSDSQPV